MIKHSALPAKLLYKKIKAGSITLGGHESLKIYGRLGCKSGKRMKRENRVFFKNAAEATEKGFRPCGNCMRTEYLKWKNEII